MRLKQYRLYGKVMNNDRIQMIPAVGYFDFLVLMQNCEYILTDSGGIQEEATSPPIRKFVFVLRNNTDRPEAVDAGYAEVVGTDPRRVLHAIKRQMSVGWKPKGKCPFGNGKAGEKIVHATMDAFRRERYGVPSKSSILGPSYLAT
jgi:UDP-N-acetylglucosamine 2-epimerase (non-hydrolysing)